MNTDRRLVLKRLAAAGLAVSVPGAASARAGQPDLSPLTPTPPAAGTAATALLAVTSRAGGAALNAAFLAGVAAGSTASAPSLPAMPALQLRGLDADAFTRLDTLLKDGEPTLLVGLTDDAAATLVLDLVRSAGGQVLAVTHHRAGGGPDAAPWALALGRDLVAGHAAASPSASAGSQACVSFRCMI